MMLKHRQWQLTWHTGLNFLHFLAPCAEMSSRLVHIITVKVVDKIYFFFHFDMYIFEIFFHFDMDIFEIFSFFYVKLKIKELGGKHLLIGERFIEI